MIKKILLSLLFLFGLFHSFSFSYKLVNTLGWDTSYFLTWNVVAIHPDFYVSLSWDKFTYNLPFGYTLSSFVDSKLVNLQKKTFSYNVIKWDDSLAIFGVWDLSWDNHYIVDITKLDNSSSASFSWSFNRHTARNVSFISFDNWKKQLVYYFSHTNYFYYDVSTRSFKHWTSYINVSSFINSYTFANSYSFPVISYNVGDEGFSQYLYHWYFNFFPWFSGFAGMALYDTPNNSNYYDLEYAKNWDSATGSTSVDFYAWDNVPLYTIYTWNKIYYQFAGGVAVVDPIHCQYYWLYQNVFYNYLDNKFYNIPSDIHSPNTVNDYNLPTYLVPMSAPVNWKFNVFTSFLKLPSFSIPSAIPNIFPYQHIYSFDTWDIYIPVLFSSKIPFCGKSFSVSISNGSTSTGSTSSVSSSWVIVNISNINNNYNTWLQSSWTLAWLKMVSSSCPVSISWLNYANPTIWWFTILGWTAPSYKPFENFVCLFSILDWSFNSWSNLSFTVNVYSWKNVINQSYWWKLNDYHWPWFWDILILLIIFSLWFNILFWQVASWEMNYWEKKMQKYEFKKHWEITRDDSKSKK